MTCADPLTPARRAEDEQAARFARRFGETLRLGDAKLGRLIIDEATAAGLEVGALHCRVIAPAMKWIGDLWGKGALTAADEHLATAICQDMLARLFPRLLNATARSREVVMLAGAPGEQHVLGLRMTADMLEGAGFDVRYLGADVPLGALLKACEKHRPSVLCLTATMAHNVPALREELIELSRLESGPLLLVGGAAVADELDLPFVSCSEQVVLEVEQLLALGHQPALLTPSAAAQTPWGPGLALVSDVGGTETLAGQFSVVAAASAETARAGYRRAHAMERLALRDALTGVWNRRAFDDRFAEFSALFGNAFLLLLDVDRFKETNDSHGHDVGDETLVAVAEAVSRSVRPGDFAARYGGDEFVVLLPGTDMAEASSIADRIRLGVSSSARARGLTVSIGISPLLGDQRLTFIAADRALYRAKVEGRDRVVAGAL